MNNSVLFLRGTVNIKSQPLFKEAEPLVFPMRGILIHRMVHIEAVDEKGAPHPSILP